MLVVTLEHLCTFVLLTLLVYIVSCVLCSVVNIEPVVLRVEYVPLSRICRPYLRDGN